MKYSMKALDNSLYFLLPKIAEAKEKGIYFSRTDLLRMVAEEFFVDQLDLYTTMSYSYEKRVAYMICQEASKDLKIDGSFAFGDLEFEC